MDSPTLKMIMAHWPNFPQDETGFVELPFNIEAFCAENDNRIEALNKVYLAAKLLSSHIHVTPTTERMVRPDHHESLKAAIEELEGK